MKVIDDDSILALPPELFKCPICKSNLFINEFDAFDQDKDGLWYAADICVECETEPDIDNDNCDEWLKGHYGMPYVDWLPLEIKVLEWLKKNYRFDLDGILNKQGR